MVSRQEQYLTQSVYCLGIVKISRLNKQTNLLLMLSVPDSQFIELKYYR